MADERKKPEEKTSTGENPAPARSTEKAAPQATAAAKGRKITDLAVDDLMQLIGAEIDRRVQDRLRVINPGSLAGVHVNSGPPGFVNGGGHANFDPKGTLSGGAHVNSGPPGFVNGGGHANFDPARGVHVNSGPPGFVNGGGHANFDPKVAAGGASGAHVNSGPPGFVNGGGHANFDPKGTLSGGSHVNSGPPGFVNGGGHANFDPAFGRGQSIVTLPDGGRVSVPASGPIDMRIRGFRITR